MNSDVMPRQEVLKFAQEMERKLRLHDDRPHWKDSDFDYLFGRLKEEFFELLDEVTSEEIDPKKIIDEAADVANFAMMIADNARKLL